ncbi:unnamed protein product [Rhodiola kirilowii]
MMAAQYNSMNQNAQIRNRANGTSFGGKGISKAPSKEGRKPLGEISNSNSLKPPKNNISKKQQTLVDYTYLGDVKGVKKSSFSIDQKKTTLNSVKNATLGARKPLGDISNARKPTLPSEKTKAKNANVLELGDPGIGERGYLHNHAECIKSQRKVVDMDYFFETIGLCKDTSPNMSPSLNSSNEEDMDLHYNEVSELLDDEYSPLHSKAKLPTKFKCSPPCKSPNSPSLYMQWCNGDTMECGLAETPTVLMK